MPDDRDLKEQALLALAEAHERCARNQERAKRLAEKLEDLVCLLKMHPERIDTIDPGVLNENMLRDLVREIRESIQEKDDALQHAQEMGCPSLGVFA